MKWLKRLLGIWLGFFTLMLFFGGMVLMVMDPNDYKDHIVQFVKEQTGRNLHLDGEIQLSFWPKLGLQVNDVSLENASNRDVFARLKQASVQINFLPLLKRQIEINALFLEGVTLALVRRADGHTNWEDLVTGSSETKRGRGELILHEFKLREAQLLWDDQMNKTKIVFSNINLDVLQKLTQVNLSTTIESQQIKQHIDLKTQLEVKPPWVKLSHLSVQMSEALLTGELQADHFLTENLTLTGKLKLHWTPPKNYLKQVTAETELEATLSNIHLNHFYIDADSHTLSFPQLSLDITHATLEGNSFLFKVAGINFRGEIKGTQMFTQPFLSGQFNSEPVNLSQVLASLKLAKLSWQPKKTTLKTRFEVNSSEIHLNQLILQVDDNQLMVPKLRVHLAQQSLTSENFSLDALGKSFSVSGKLIGKEVFSHPQWRGELVATSSQLQGILARFKVPPWPIHQLHLRTQFMVTSREVVLSNTQVILDEQDFSSKNVNFYIPHRKLTIEKWISKVFGIVGEGNWQIEFMSPNYQMRGNLSLAEFNLRHLLQKLGKDIATSDNTVLDHVTLETQVTGNSYQLSFEKLNLHWDNSQLKGQFDVEDFKKPRMRFDLDLDDIDVSRYLPPSFQEKDKKKSDFTLLFKQLKDLDLDGSVKVAALKMAGLKMTGINLVFKGRKNAERSLDKSSSGLHK